MKAVKVDNHEIVGKNKLLILGDCKKCLKKNLGRLAKTSKKGMRSEVYFEFSTETGEILRFSSDHHLTAQYPNDVGTISVLHDGENVTHIIPVFPRLEDMDKEHAYHNLMASFGFVIKHNKDPLANDKFIEQSVPVVTGDGNGTLYNLCKKMKKDEESFMFFYDKSSGIILRFASDEKRSPGLEGGFVSVKKSSESGSDKFYVEMIYPKNNNPTREVYMRLLTLFDLFNAKYAS